MIKRLSAFRVAAPREPCLRGAGGNVARGLHTTGWTGVLALVSATIGLAPGCEQATPADVAASAQGALHRVVLEHGNCVGTTCDGLPEPGVVTPVDPKICEVVTRSVEVTWWAESGTRPCTLTECDSVGPVPAVNARGDLWVKAEVVHDTSANPRPMGEFLGAYGRDGDLEQALDVPAPPIIGRRIQVDGHGVDEYGRVRWVAARGNTRAVDLRMGHGRRTTRRHLVDGVSAASGSFSPDGSLRLLHTGELASDALSTSVNLSSFDARGELLWNQVNLGDYYETELLGVADDGTTTLLGRSFDGPVLVRVAADGQVRSRHRIDFGGDGFIDSAALSPNGDVHLAWEAFTITDTTFESNLYLDRIASDGELAVRVDLAAGFARVAGVDADGRAILTWGFQRLRRVSLDGTACEDWTFDSEIFVNGDLSSAPFFCSDRQCGPIHVRSDGGTGLFASGPSIIAHLEVSE